MAALPVVLAVLAVQTVFSKSSAEAAPVPPITIGDWTFLADLGGSRDNRCLGGAHPRRLGFCSVPQPFVRTAAIERGRTRNAIP